MPKDRKASGYIAFASIMRPKLKEMKPNLEFGELSREVGSRVSMCFPFVRFSICFFSTCCVLNFGQRPATLMVSSSVVFSELLILYITDFMFYNESIKQEITSFPSFTEMHVSSFNQFSKIINSLINVAFQSNLGVQNIFDREFFNPIIKFLLIV